MNLENLILNFQKQLESDFQISKKISIRNSFSNIIFCGMGGSALSSSLIISLSKTLQVKIPLYLHQDYRLPHWVNKNSLIICISYSGNTEETISAYNEAIKNKLQVIAISTGGKLKKLALENKKPFIEIPFKNIQPRFSIWFQLMILLKIFNNFGIIKKFYINELLNASKNLDIKILKNQAENLAKKIKNKILLIYGSVENNGILKIWKANFNENAKIPIFYNVFPEINHNEIAFLENKNINKIYFCSLFFQLGNESSQIKKRINLTQQIFKNFGIKTLYLNLEKSNLFESIFSSIILGELTSIYLAKIYNINPEKIEIIEKFKKMMEK